MRFCSRCEQEKDIETEFYTDKNGRISFYCKKCNSELHINYRRERKKRCIALKGGKCAACGYSKSVAAMDFHHLDPTKKEFQIGSILCWSDKRLMGELEKCVLLCANCHRELHAKEDLDEEEQSVGDNILGQTPSSS